MSERLRGQTALVTGASQGIGLAIGIALAEAGASVAFNYRQRPGEATAAVEAIHRIVSDPGRLSESWYRRTVAAGLSEEAYVELLSLVAITTAVDTLDRALGAKLRAQGLTVRVVNAGVSGDTTAGGVARLDWALADKPAIVLLELGANDALRGVEPPTVRRNLEQMIEKIQASGAKLLLLGMQAPPNWGTDYQREFDRIYPELAKAHNVPLYPFVLEGVAMNPQLNQPENWGLAGQPLEERLLCRARWSMADASAAA